MDNTGGRENGANRIETVWEDPSYGKAIYEYDEKGRVVRTALYNTENEVVQEDITEYDQNDNIIGITQMKYDKDKGIRTTTEKKYGKTGELDSEQKNIIMIRIKDY